MSQIVITGSQGFIGKHLVKYYQDLDQNVISVDNLEGPITDKWLSSNGLFDSDYIIFHLAARTREVDSDTNGFITFNANIKATQNVLELCRVTNSRMVYLSSMIYDVQNGNSKFVEDDPVKPASIYLLSKYVSEELGRLYSDLHGVPVVVLRLFNVYGPGQSHRFLIPHILSQVGTGFSIRLRNLYTKRDYVFIDDVVQAIHLSGQLDCKFTTINIGSGRAVAVNEIVETIQTIVETNLPILDDNRIEPNEIITCVANIEKAHKTLMWSPKISLLDGLKETCRSWDRELSKLESG